MLHLFLKGDKMDKTKRQITKIAREAGKLTVRMMREEGIGTGEFDLIHLVRHSPGISQKEVSDELNMDKGATARRVASLEEKGYLVRTENPSDGRSRFLYATEKAEKLKNSKTSVETAFYEWLIEGLNENEQDEFARLLDILYTRSKEESRKGFSQVIKLLKQEDEICG